MKITVARCTLGPSGCPPPQSYPIDANYHQIKKKKHFSGNFTIKIALTYPPSEADMIILLVEKLI